MSDNNINNNDEFNDELIFASEDQVEIIGSEEKWKILIVDDEKDVHTVTKLVAEDLIYKNKKVEFVSAYSCYEAKLVLNENPDVVLILLDVVMEEDTCGLKFVEYVRNVIKNKQVRIILRTGYPGQAPERQIVIDYDINDYKEKTELSSQKLITAIISALRSYEDFTTILELNKNLENKVKERTKELENANLQLNSSLELIKKDLRAGRKIQFKLMPAKNLKIGDYEFSRYLQPSLYLSGDFVNYFKIDEDNIGFYFADVSGHGAASAFITVLLKNYFENLKRNYKEEKNQTILNPAAVLSKINCELISDDLDKFITIFYGVISQSKKTLSYINAGQFPFPILKSDSLNITLKSDTSPVGMFVMTKYENKVLDLPEHFILFLASDGILEIIDKETMYEKQDSLLEKKDWKTITIVEIISEYNLENLKNIPDDITIMLIRK